jgi:bidirectional [NiFe] hydrogenase diaphorase subunit
LNKVNLQIEGKMITARAGTTLLEAARESGITIPTLCYDGRLEPYGCCRMCLVEVEGNGRKNLVAACFYPVEENLIVKTQTEKVRKIRKVILELVLAHAPDSPVLQRLAKEYGADKNHFDKETSFCILCGLCVRYCAEVKKKNAICFIDRGTRREIIFSQEIAAKECESCKECFPLCPTGALQAAYVFTKVLHNPSPLAVPESEK